MVGRVCRWRSTRRRLIGATALAGTGALAACGAPGAASPSAPAGREVALSYVTGWSGGARGEYVVQAIQAFNQEHPGLTVRADAWVGNVATAALASAAAGTLQDVMLNSNDVFIHLARAGGMPDLTPVLKAQRVSMGDLVQLPSTYTYQGKQHGMPFHLLVQSLVVNKTLLRQHGAPLPDGRTTFAQLLDAMRRVARPAENVYGYHTSGVAGNWAYWWPWVWGYGGDRWTPDLRRSRLGEPASIEGLQFYVDLMYRHGVATPLSDAGTPVPEGVAFASGNLAVAHTSSPGAALDREVGGRFEWDVMYHPLGPRTNKRHVFTNNQAHIVTSGAAGRGVVEQAARLAVWLAASKTAQDLVVAIGPDAMPVLKSVLASPRYLAGPPAGLKILNDMAPDYVDPQIFIGWNEFRDAVGAALRPAFAGKQAVADAAAEAARAGDLILQKIPS